MSRPNTVVIIMLSLLLSARAVVAQTSRPAPPGSRGIPTHDPSTIVSCNGEYWLFATGSGVPSYRSRDLLNWQPGPRTLQTLPAWTQKYDLRRDRLWAPDVVRAPDGRYFLYYSASSWGKNTSAIGLAINATLDPADANYRWIDHGIVIASEPADNFNAIDPAVMLDADGRMWMSFGSFWSGIKLIELDPRTGKRISPDSKLYALASAREIEAPFIHRRGDQYYLFVNHGLCCRGIESTYEIRVGRSDRVTGPYLDRDGKDLNDGGGTLLLNSDRQANFIGPGHASIVVAGADGQEWLACHFYDGTNRGRGTLALRRLTWTNDGWPTVAGGDASQ